MSKKYYYYQKCLIIDKSMWYKRNQTRFGMLLWENNQHQCGNNNSFLPWLTSHYLIIVHFPIRSHPVMFYSSHGHLKQNTIWKAAYGQLILS